MPARTKFTIEGTTGGGAEQWTTSFHMGASTAFTQPQFELMAIQVNAHWLSEVWTTSGVGILDLFAPSTAYVRTTVRDIAANGLTARVFSVGPASPVLGAGVSASLPTEVAEVVSLNTATAGGRGRGRMYLPALATANCVTTGLVSSAAVSEIADSLDSFFNTSNADTNLPDSVAVWSTVDQTLRNVTQLRVGNVFDAQRRRRNQLIEVYESRAV